MTLIVALDESGHAHGRLYWDDGEARNVGHNHLWLTFSCSEVEYASRICIHECTSCVKTMQQLARYGHLQPHIEFVLVAGCEVHKYHVSA